MGAEAEMRTPFLEPREPPLLSPCVLITWSYLLLMMTEKCSLRGGAMTILDEF